jgi:DtxR family transcriptional regulator, Mn-dependent transcriptional regulator
MAALPAHLEAYLKAILQLEERGAPVRAKDVATALGLSRPSVSKAAAALAREEYVVHQPYMALSLTPKGRRTALEVARRERVLRDFLKRVLGLDEATAERDAAALEQAVSGNTLHAFADFLGFLDTCRRGPSDILRHFHDMAPGASPEGCSECGYERTAVAVAENGHVPAPRRRRPAGGLRVRVKGIAEPPSRAMASPDRGSRRS